MAHLHAMAGRFRRRARPAPDRAMRCSRTSAWSMHSGGRALRRVRRACSPATRRRRGRAADGLRAAGGDGRARAAGDHRGAARRALIAQGRDEEAWTYLDVADEAAASDDLNAHMLSRRERARLLAAAGRSPRPTDSAPRPSRSPRRRTGSRSRRHAGRPRRGPPRRRGRVGRGRRGPQSSHALRAEGRRRIRRVGRERSSTAPAEPRRSSGANRGNRHTPRPRARYERRPTPAPAAQRAHIEDRALRARGGITMVGKFDDTLHGAGPREAHRRRHARRLHAGRQGRST